MVDERYIAWADYAGTWYFKEGLQDGIFRDVDDEDLPFIRPLTFSYGEQLWDTFVSSKTDHLMKIHNGDDDPPYTNYQLRAEINYEQYLKLDNGIGLFAAELTPYVMKKSDEPIYFFWSKGDAVETVWSIFLKYWPHFTVDDEADILILPYSTTAFVFCLGNCSILERPE